jgi:hypothetical protein
MVGFHIHFTYIDDARSNINQVNIAYCIVVSNRIHDQPDDGLEKKAETCSCS